MSDVTGKTVLVTGASSGVGRHFAAQLARNGAIVVAAARRMDALMSLVEEIGDAGRIHPIALDVSSLSSIRSAVDAAEAVAGPIEILINNAGIAHSGKIVDTSEADYDRVLNTNVKGAFFVAQEIAARMIANKIEGRIVNIASVAGLVVMPQLTVYCMSKAALIQMTKCMASEWARYGINVNVLCPGYLSTKLNEDYWASDAGQKTINSLPRRRLGRPEDLDAALGLLISGASASLINGAVLSVDDGYSLS